MEATPSLTCCYHEFVFVHARISQCRFTDTITVHARLAPEIFLSRLTIYGLTNTATLPTLRNAMQIVCGDQTI
jgi:hypothetical protein